MGRFDSLTPNFIMDETTDAPAYKPPLLGAAAKNVCAPADDPRRVVIESMELLIKGSDTPSKMALDTPENIKKAAETVWDIPEGSDYTILFNFRVQHEIVSGLRFNLKIKKGPFSTTDKEMLGSYAPDGITKTHKVEATAPSGMAKRGTYNCTGSFLDDDGNQYVTWTYKIKISKV